MSPFEQLKRREGWQLCLRLVEIDDAPYIHGLRTNPRFAQYLSAVTGTVADQQSWLSEYKKREGQLKELYYIIERNDGTPCGTVRLYAIKKKSFTWGSWILDDSKPPKAALESALLSFEVGFSMLNCTMAHVDVRAENEHAASLYRRMQMDEVRQTATDIYFEYRREVYLRHRPEYRAILLEVQHGRN